jgi:hypothetical protein
MKPDEASKIEVGDRVMWDNDPNDAGTVTGKISFGFRVRWDAWPLSSGWLDFTRSGRVQKIATEETTDGHE